MAPADQSVPGLNLVSPKRDDVFRIGVYQGPTVIDTFENNACKTYRILAAAHQYETDFAIVPECFLTGDCLTTQELREADVAVNSKRFKVYTEIVPDCKRLLCKPLFEAEWLLRWPFTAMDGGAVMDW